ncbi:MAG: GDSL-type esterase/lipase family protein [Planctomycetota bacterium]
MRRKFTLILIGSLLALMALEAALQVLAFLNWQRRGRTELGSPRDARETVLCVGDSFTFGLGATDSNNAWPAAAERAFAALRPERPLRFSNLGWPGSNSAAVLGRLPRQLEAERPRYVCILVGYNDFWSDERSEESSESFPIEFRTLRLFRMIGAWLAGGPPSRASSSESEGATPVSSPVSLPRQDAPFRGAWHHGSAWIDFLDDGRVVSNGGELPVAWFHDAGAIWLEMRDGTPRQRIAWQLTDDALDLDSAAFGGRLRWERGLPPGDLLARARHATMRGDFATAEAALRDSLAVNAPDRETSRAIRAELGRVLVRRGKAAEAAGELPALVEGFRASPSLPVAEQLVPLAADLAKGDVATELIVTVLRGLPATAAALHLVMRYALTADDPLAVDSAVQQVLSRDGIPIVLRLGLLGLRPVLHSQDLEVTLDSLVHAAAIVENDDQRGSLLRAVAFDRGRLSRDALRAALDRSSLDAAARARSLAEFERAWAMPDRTGVALAANLRRIVAVSRAAGAEPILLDYPLDRPDVLEVVDRVASESNVPRIRLGAHFQRIVAPRSRSDWYIADGHCNDRGYVEMGRMVAEFLADLPR